LEIGLGLGLGLPSDSGGNHLHRVQKKTPTHVLFYISMEDIQILTKLSVNV